MACWVLVDFLLDCWGAVRCHSRPFLLVFLEMKLKLARVFLMFASAVLPGAGPLFYGASRLSVFGVTSGIALLLAFGFLILVAINGEFAHFETHYNLSLIHI